MILDKLLAFADGKALTSDNNSGEITLGEIEFGSVGDEIARTMNLFAQVDAFGTSPTTTNTLKPELKGYNTALSSPAYETIMTFPTLAVSAVQAGKRLVDFAKLPLGMAKYSKLKLAVTVATSAGETGSLPIGTTFTAGLTPSAELN